MIAPLTEFLDRLTRLADAATPGPWEPCLGSGNCEMTALSHQSQDGPGTEFVCDFLPDWAVELSPRKAENMEFIAALDPETVRALVGAARAARHASDDIRQLGGTCPNITWHELEDALARLANAVGGSKHE